MTDAELVEASRRGEREAFGQLVERYQRMVEAVAYSATGRRALVDDVVQDTFVTAWRTLDRLRDAELLRAWLGGIARNIARNARRNQKRVTTVDAISTTQTPFEDVSDAERDREIAAALARLPRRYREPIVLFYYEHCTVKQVAQALALREDAVMQRLSRGRRRLGEALATHVEVTLERKPSRAALAACVLAILPVRTVASAPLAAEAATVATTTAATTSVWWRTSLAMLATHWRIPGAVLACAAGLIILVVATERSNAIAAKHAAPSPAARPAEPQARTTPPPKLPTDRADDTNFYRNIVVASTDPAESCARGARGVVHAALGRDSLRVVGDARFYEPSPELERIADAVAAKTAAGCGGEGAPEIYLICEATLFEVLDGNVTCYPWDPFDSV